MNSIRVEPRQVFASRRCLASELECTWDQIDADKSCNLEWRWIQGCQMVSFQTKNSDLGKFWTALGGKMLLEFMAIWNILWTFGIFYDHLEHFGFLWYIFYGFGIMYQEKYGNPGWIASDPVWP
jgi:hypothetical protein